MMGNCIQELCSTVSTDAASSETNQGDDTFTPLLSAPGEDVTTKSTNTEVSTDLYELGRQLSDRAREVKTWTAEDLRRQIDQMCKLGNEYMTLAEATSDPWYFVRGSGIFNATLRVIEKLKQTLQKDSKDVGDDVTLVESDCENRLKQIETLFIEKALKIPDPVRVGSQEKYDEALKELRKYSTGKINEIVENDMKIDPVTTEMDETNENNTIKSSKAFYDELTKKLKEFYCILIDDCVTVLGRPKCKFCIIGLGSLARKEATAFSDLESALLYDSSGMSDTEVEETKQKFRLIVHYFHLKVLNLGETILPSLSIPVLNDFNENLPDDMKDNEFFDTITPMGMSFDGAMPYASKTPLGRCTTKPSATRGTEGKPARELIMTPEEMSSYQHEAICLKEGYHLSDVLLTTTVIYGDDSLLETYNECLQKILNSPSSKNKAFTVGNVRADETLREDFQKFLENPLTPEKLSRQVRVKKDIYRFATMSVNTLKLKYNCASQAPIDILEELYEKKIISERAKKDLQLMICICINLRHLVYSRYQRQKEVISFVSHKSDRGRANDGTESLSVRDYIAIYRFYLTFLPWKDFLKSNITSEHQEEWNYPPRYIETSDKIKGMLHQEMRFFDNALRAFKNEEARLEAQEGCKEEEAAIQTCIGALYQTNGMLRKGLEYHEKALETQKEIHGEEIHRDVAAALNDIGKMHFHLGDHSTSLEHHKKALSMYENISKSEDCDHEIAITRNHIGEVYLRLADYGNALLYQEPCISLYRKIFPKEPDATFANALDTFASIYCFQGKFKQSMKYVIECYEMRRNIWRDVPHSDVATSLNNIGHVHHRSNESEKALPYFEQCLEMKKQVYGDIDHPDIATVLHNIGGAYLELNNSDNAMKYCREAYNIRKQVYGDKPHRHFGASLHRLGKIYLIIGENNEALKLLNESRQMNEIVFGKKPHPEIAKTIGRIGDVYSNNGDKDTALKYLNESLEMYKVCFESNSSIHPEVATILGRIGDVYSSKGEDENALEKYEQSREMFTAVFDDESHPMVSKLREKIHGVKERIKSKEVNTGEKAGDDTMLL